MNPLKPVLVPLKAKGGTAVIRRGLRILQRYGPTPGKMDSILGQFVDLLAQFNCRGTFPITASVLARNPAVIRRYQEAGTEFAIHGLHHVDYSRLTLAEQKQHLAQAAGIFRQAGVDFAGFRCPYLRWNRDTLQALRETGLRYDSSQALVWDVAGQFETPAYHRVQAFYRAVSADQHPSLPEIEAGLVRLPYAIPDDESLADRLHLAGSPAAMTGLWLAVLEKVHHLGEMFVLGLHPERFDLCRQPLEETLRQATAPGANVWTATLRQISDWWLARAGTRLQITQAGPGRYQVICTGGPDGLVVLARKAQVTAETRAGENGYRQVQAAEFTLLSDRHPVVGVSNRTHPALVAYLRQMGYPVETATDPAAYSVYLDRPDFGPEDRRALLAQVEQADGPLVKLARWPNAASCALAVSGDIDALTVFDYAIRAWGK